jgi:lysophospholipase
MLRRALNTAALTAALCLAACGRGAQDLQPFADSQVPPTLAERFMPPDGWAWGFLSVGDAPVQRYGVSAPPGVAPRGAFIILPGYGETAEAWFETARDLNAAGYNVWVLEGAGQGGSERLAGPRDVGFTRDMEGDVRAVRALLRVVVRAPAHTPVVLLVSGAAAPVGLRAAELDPFGLSRVVLSDPQALPRPSGGFELPFLGAMRAAGQGEWRRPEPADLSPRRGAAARWTIANPDLRIGGYSWGYLHAWDRLTAEATAQRRVTRARTPILLLKRVSSPFDRACRLVPRCEARPLAANDSYAWASDPARARWLATLIAAAGG